MTPAGPAAGTALTVAHCTTSMLLFHDGRIPSRGGRRLVPECGQVAFTWKNTTAQSVPWAPVVPTARPNIVGPRTTHTSCHNIAPSIHAAIAREVCPACADPDSCGHRCTCALAVRPLHPPRAWSWRLDRRRWRRRVALSGRAQRGRRCVGVGAWSPLGDRIHLGVKRRCAAQNPKPGPLRGPKPKTRAAVRPKPQKPKRKSKTTAGGQQSTNIFENPVPPPTVCKPGEAIQVRNLDLKSVC